MREGLRKISDLSAKDRVVFLAQQAETVTEGENAIDQPVRIFPASLQNVDFGEPQATGEKHALAWRQPVGATFRPVAPDESVLDQFALDRRNSIADARIIDRQEADDRHLQQARIEFAAAEALG